MKTAEEILTAHFKAEFGYEGHGSFMAYILSSMEEYKAQSPSSPTREQIVKTLREEYRKWVESSDIDEDQIDEAQATAILKLMGEGESKESVFIDLAKWLIKSRLSVFVEADISTESKKEILNKLNISSDIFT